MTTPKGTAGGSKRPSPAKAADGRLRRSEPVRGGPIRAGVAAAATKPKAAAPKPDLVQDPKVGDAVAHAVKLGYDVIAENIKQGREAAQRFRHGEYNLRDAPGDVEVAALRMLQLARELSTTTFDVCERLLKELGGQRPPQDRTTDLPAFRKPAPAAPAPAAAPGPAQADAGAMPVTVRFVGAPKAKSHTASLSRPRQPTAASAIGAAPLAPAKPGGQPIAKVSFETDVSVEGIVVVVTVPKGQPAGVYSGLVHVKGDPIPLGVLTVEISK